MPSKSMLAEKCGCLRKQMCRCYSDRPKILILYSKKNSQNKSSKFREMEKRATFLTLQLDRSYELNKGLSFSAKRPLASTKT